MTQVREGGRKQRERHHQQTEQCNRRHSLNDVEHGEYGHLRFRATKERNAERNADEQRRQQCGGDDFHVTEQRDVKDVSAHRVFPEQGEMFEFAGEQQGDDGEEHSQVSKSRSRRTETKPLDGIDGGKPRHKHEQPEGAAECGTTGRGRRFSQASRVGASEPREAEQQHRRSDGDRGVHARARDRRRRAQEPPRVGGASRATGFRFAWERSPGHQSISDGQERSPQAAAAAPITGEKNAPLRLIPLRPRRPPRASLDEAFGFQIGGGHLLRVLPFDGDLGVERLQRRRVERTEDRGQGILDPGIARQQVGANDRRRCVDGLNALWIVHDHEPQRRKRAVGAVGHGRVDARRSLGGGLDGHRRVAARQCQDLVLAELESIRRLKRRQGIGALDELAARA